MKIEVLEGNPFPDILIKEWIALLQVSPVKNPFLTPTWNEIWLKHFGRNLRVQAILLRQTGGSPIALGVFSNSTEEDGRNRLKLLGSTDVYDYRDLIVSAGKEEEALGRLALFLAEGPWTDLEFSGISEFSSTIKLLPRILRSCNFQVTEMVEEVSVYLDLPQSWEEFLAQLGSKDRHELRRKMRRLEREVSFELSAEGEEVSLADRVSIFLELHRKSSPDKAQFMIPEMEAYFREISSRFQEKGWLSLTFLKVEGKEIATFFSFQFQRIEYVYNSGYDPDYGRLSPGIVLAAHRIRQAIGKGMTVFHFLRGREDYKYRLGGKEEKIYQIKAVKK